LEGRQWRVDLETKEDVLWMMWKVLVANPALKIVFGDAHGFALILSVLESIQADDHSGTSGVLSGLDESEADLEEGSHPLPRLKLRTEVFIALLHVVIAAVAEIPTNRNLLHESLVSPNFRRLLRYSGLIGKDFEEKFVELLFDLALGRVHSPSQLTQGLPTLLEKDKAGQEYFQLPGVQGSFVLDLNQTLEDEEVYNASAIGVLLFCLRQFSLKLQLRVLIRLKNIARASPRNQDALSAVGKFLRLTYPEFHALSNVNITSLKYCLALIPGQSRSPVFNPLFVGSGCVGLLLEAIRIMLPNPSSLLTCSLQLVEVLGSFR
jgi:hypothetical protein